MLITCLNREYDTPDGWRFESEPVCTGGDGSYLLLTKEEGVHSDFVNGGKQYTHTKVSKYSKGEQEDLVRSRNRRIDSWEIMDALTTEGKVYSVDHNKVYDSAEDYYLSFEHRLDRKIDSDFYASTLYRNQTTVTHSVSSNSQRYIGLYETGGFSVDSKGIVTDVNFGNFKCAKWVGDPPARKGETFTDKSPAVSCAAYLGCSNDVKRVPASIFGDRLTCEEMSYSLALQSAAVFTCLSDKLDCSDYRELEYGVTSEIEFNACRDRAMHFANNEEALDESELALVLDIVNKHLLPFNDEQTCQMKTALHARLALVQTMPVPFCFYVDRCVEFASEGARVYRTPYFSEMLLQMQAETADRLLRIKEREQAARYAQGALDACDQLARLDPSNDLLSMRADIEKLVKKSRRKGLFGF